MLLRIKNWYSWLSVKHVANSVGSFLRLYYESLQALVDGYREVTMDPKQEFQFDNGETVKDRMKAFEERLHEYSTGRKL